MKTVITLPELHSAREELLAPLGLVPTMGYLHAGHLSLVRRARAECQSVVVSIFVNPTQFGPDEDLDAYPRDIPRDLALLEDEGVDLVWMPSVEVMYPPGFQSWVTVEEVTQPLEGKYRPEHFRGVTTVVTKLFGCSAGPGLFRSERCSAGCRHPPPGARLELPYRNRCLPHCARTRRIGDVQPQ